MGMMFPKGPKRKKRHKRTIACDIDDKTRKIVEERDGHHCIFCELGYFLPTEDYLIECHQYEIMHFIPRSQSGKGIPENLAVGCRFHHRMLDNGSEGLRDDMLWIFQCYLMARYPDWNKKDLIYDKWGWLRER